MPFQPGQSGNLGGKKPIDPEIKAALKAACPKAIKVLIALLNSNDEDIRFKAAKEIIERQLGKVVQPLGNDDDEPFRLLIEHDNSTKTDGN